MRPKRAWQSTGKLTPALHGVQQEDCGKTRSYLTATLRSSCRSAGNCLAELSPLGKLAGSSCRFVDCLDVRLSSLDGFAPPHTMAAMTNGAAQPHRSFLVTCVGAYDDSGIGTGGFVCVHDGKATVIDKIDSTGLCESGGTYYRFARGLRSIIGYRSDGIRFLLKIPEARDVHDFTLREGQFRLRLHGR
jgi:hypothetical protein